MTVNYYHCRNKCCMVNRTFCKAAYLGQEERRYAFYKGKANSAACYKKRKSRTVPLNQNFIFPSVQKCAFSHLVFPVVFFKKTHFLTNQLKSCSTVLLWMKSAGTPGSKLQCSVVHTELFFPFLKCIHT